MKRNVISKPDLAGMAMGPTLRHMEETMQVKDMMSGHATTIGPTDSARQAAKLMRANNIGLLPVLENGKAVGVLTDRDIVVRGVADSSDIDELTVRDLMTLGPVGISEDESIERAFDLMKGRRVGRLLVFNHDGILTGVLSAADLAIGCDGDARAGSLANSLAKVHKTPPGTELARRR